MPSVPLHSTHPPHSIRLSFLCGAIIALLGIRVSQKTVLIVVKRKQGNKPLPSVSWHESPSYFIESTRPWWMTFLFPPEDSGARGWSSVNDILNPKYQYILLAYSVCRKMCPLNCIALQNFERCFCIT